MTQHIPATYSQGVFAPDAPAELAEGAKVNLTVSPREEPPLTPQQALEGLREIASRIRIPPDFKFLTREELNDRRRH
jgi:predicted DNA-binding antitoxin AbrB/MazE fold protein